MVWKIYSVHSGKIVKAGFEEEENAKDWLEARHNLSAEDYLIEEMDADEEEIFNKGEEAEEEEEEEELDEKIVGDSASLGYDDDYLDPDEGIINEIIEEGDDEGEEEEEEEE